MTPTYWIARSRILDPVRYFEYAKQVPAIIEKYGAKVLSRGASFNVVEGAPYYSRYVLLEFPSMEAALACFNSQEHQSARRHRLDGAGEAEVTLLSAGDFTSLASLEAARSGS